MPPSTLVVRYQILIITLCCLCIIFFPPSSNAIAISRQMVIFKPPSRHTYGFVSDNFGYDLPELELHSLLCLQHNDVRFIPVVVDLFQRGSLLRWIESADGLQISDDDVSNAVSRAVLAHASFSIDESSIVTEEDWNDDSTFSSIIFNNQLSMIDILERLDVVDMSNPNMSRVDKVGLMERVICLIDKQEPKLQLRLQEWIRSIVHDDVQELRPVVLVHCNQQNNNFRADVLYHIYFGHRTSIGLAGTRGAPSQTLRRTHRGLLKEYALKNRRTCNADTRFITSTAMEPEIGFLMANLALAGAVGGAKRVLDPGCGSGRLLLYAAELGSTEVVGVDSDPYVWDTVDWEDHVRVCPNPKFFVGDVQDPTSVDVLNTPDSFDAMVCDPPYNIGAPVYVNGKDSRPKNYHDIGEELQQDETSKLPMDSLTDLVPSILSIAAKVLVKGGRIVFLLPVRGDDMDKSLEELLSLRGCPQVVSDDGNESCQLRLVQNSSRLQKFSPTFSRWLVCMEKI